MSGRLLAEQESDDEDFDDEEYESVAAATSRLGNLFAQSNTTVEGSNSSLIYKAPKPPSVKETISVDVVNKPEDDNVAIKVLYAVPVHVFLLQNNQYVPQGKLGLAILGNKARKDFKILIYLHNKQPVGQSSLRFESEIFVQKNDYVQFVDDRQQFWSVAFDAEIHLVDFLKWYLASKALMLGDKRKEIFSIDVGEGEGRCVGLDDSVEIEYTEYLIEDGPQLTEFNGSNANRPLRIKIGKGKVPKGWEDGLVGMKKFGKRLFVIPPDLGYSGRDKNATFPTNVPLMVYVIVKRVKYSSAKSDERKFSDASSASKKSEIHEASLERESGREESVTSSGAELNFAQLNTESDDSEASRKADILTRMAKIGQSLMPSQVLPSRNIDESQQPTPVAVEQQKPVVPPRHNHELAIVCADMTLARPTITQTMAGVSKSQSEGTISQRAQGQLPTDEPALMPAVSSSMAMPPNLPYMYPYPMPYHPYHFLMPPSGAATGAGTPFSLTPDMAASSTSSLERQNAMIVDEIQKSHVQLQDALTKLLNDTLTNFSRRVTDINGNLDLKLNKLQTSITATTNDDGGIGSNDLVVSKLDNLETLVKSMSDKSLTEENSSNNYYFVTVEEKLQTCTEQLNSMQISINELKNALSNDSSHVPVVDKLSRIDEKLSTLQNLKDKMDSVQDELRSNQEWNKRYDKLKSQAMIIKEKYEERISLLTEHLHRLQQQLETVKNDKTSSFAEEQKLKKIMNNFYKSISVKFLPYESYLGEDVRKQLMDCIKESTLRILGNKEIVAPDHLEEEKIENANAKSSLESETKPESEKIVSETGKKDEIQIKIDKKLAFVQGSAESEDQEFYDAAFSTPPRFCIQDENGTTTVQKVDENMSREAPINAEISSSNEHEETKSVDDLDDESNKKKCYAFPLLDTQPPPLPDNCDE